MSLKESVLKVVKRGGCAQNVRNLYVQISVAFRGIREAEKRNTFDRKNVIYLFFFSAIPR